MEKVKLIPLTFIVFLTACWNANEVDKFYYAYTLGLDYNEGMYDAYIQYVSFSIGGQLQSGGGGGDERGVVGHGRGKTIETAIHNMYKTAPLNTYWGHLSVMIFSEKLLKNNELNIIDFQSRFRDMRFTPWVFVTSEPLEEFLVTQPFFNVSLAYSLYSDPMKDYRQSSLVIPIRLHSYVANMFEPGRTNIIPYLSIDKKMWSSDKGRIPTVEISGGSIQKGGVFKGTLENKVLGGLNWVKEETERSPLIIENENGDAVGVIVINNMKAKITPIIQGTDVRFDLDVTGNGVIVEMFENVPVSQFIKAGEKQMKEEIITTYENALKLNADIYQLGEVLHHKNPKLFHRLTKKNNELPLTKESIGEIKTTLKIKHTGRLKYQPINKKMNLN